MTNTKYNQRWYDHDPTISLAVSLIRNTSVENQKLVLEFVREQAAKKGVKLTFAKTKSFSLFFRRKYDKNELFYDIMEYLRHAESEIQKELAMEVINYLYVLDGSEDKGII